MSDDNKDDAKAEGESEQLTIRVKDQVSWRWGTCWSCGVAMSVMRVWILVIFLCSRSSKIDGAAMAAAETFHSLIMVTSKSDARHNA